MSEWLPMLPSQVEPFQRHLQGDHASGFIARAYELSGEIDVEAVVVSLRGLHAENEALRCSFSNHEPSRQRVSATQANVEMLDVSDTTDESVVHDYLRWRVYRDAIDWDLWSDGVYRARLLRLAPDRHIILLGYQHIAVDARSIAILESQLFGTNKDGVDRPSYKDAVSRRSVRKDRVSAMRYWESQERLLASNSPVPKPAILKILRANVTGDSLDSLGRIARASGVSVPQLLFHRFGSQVLRETEQTSVVIDFVIDERSAPENQLVGNFAHNVPVVLGHADVDSAEAATAALLSALANRPRAAGKTTTMSLPIEAIRHTSTQPINFNFVRHGATDPNLAAWASEPKVNRFPVHLNYRDPHRFRITLNETIGGLSIALRFNPMLDEEASALRILESVVQ